MKKLFVLLLLCCCGMLATAQYADADKCDTLVNTSKLKFFNLDLERLYVLSLKEVRDTLPPEVVTQLLGDLRGARSDVEDIMKALSDCSSTQEIDRFRSELSVHLIRIDLSMTDHRSRRYDRHPDPGAERDHHETKSRNLPVQPYHRHRDGQ